MRSDKARSLDTMLFHCPIQCLIDAPDVTLVRGQDQPQSPSCYLRRNTSLFLSLTLRREALPDNSHLCSSQQRNGVDPDIVIASTDRRIVRYRVAEHIPKLPLSGADRRSSHQVEAQLNPAARAESGRSRPIRPIQTHPSVGPSPCVRAKLRLREACCP